jgi:hypothetical protein
MEFPYKDARKQLRILSELPVQLTFSSRSLHETIVRLHDYVSIVLKRDILFTVSAKAGKKIAVVTAATSHSKFRELVKLKSACKKDMQAEMVLPLLLPFASHVSRLGEVRLAFDDKSPFVFHSQDSVLLLGRKAPAKTK